MAFDYVVVVVVVVVVSAWQPGLLHLPPTVTVYMCIEDSVEPPVMPVRELISKHARC